MTRFKLLMPLGIIFSLFFIPSIMLSGCNSSVEKKELPDTIKVATFYGPASFFYYRDTILGYDHDIMEELAAEHARSIIWVIVNSLEEAVEKINSGEVSIIAAPVPVDNEYHKDLIPCGPATNIEQVLVQPPGDTIIVDINQLAGRTIYVEKDSKGAKELEKINKKLGNAITIRQVDADSIATEDMLAAVAKGDIPLAVVDRTTARINKSYFPQLNITLALSLPEEARWAVGRKDKWIAHIIDAWEAEPHPQEVVTDILQKYLDSRKNFPLEGAKYDRQFNNGYASPYDHLFKEHAEGTSWDWRMLAAQAYQESKFDSTARSWAGAQGVMQIMPGTARDFGLKKSEVTNASKSIETAVKILNRYDDMLASEINDPIERKKFTLAAYNAGPGHVLDAIRLAKKYGLDSQIWDDNVEKAMLMKMNRKYYRDPVVKYGYSRGRETVDYVERIYAYYDEATEKIPH